MYLFFNLNITFYYDNTKKKNCIYVNYYILNRSNTEGCRNIRKLNKDLN